LSEPAHFSFMAIQIPIHVLSPLVTLPEYATAGAAGMDLPAAVLAPVVIEPGAFALVACGFAMAVPEGYEAQIRPRSGLAARHGVTVLNAPGTVDSDYRGEVKVLLINHGKEPFEVTAGMRIAQMVVAAVARSEWDRRDELPDTRRGAGGFGHTGQ
jgi:dUTP pyrophosphatase